MNYTHYDFLEIAPGADSARVEAAYVALLERMSFGASESGQDLSGLVRRVHAAYDVLSDPDKREAYDAKLAAEAEQADMSSGRCSTCPAPRPRATCRTCPHRSPPHSRRSRREVAVLQSRFAVAGVT